MSERHTVKNFRAEDFNGNDKAPKKRAARKAPREAKVNTVKDVDPPKGNENSPSPDAPVSRDSSQDEPPKKEAQSEKKTEKKTEKKAPAKKAAEEKTEK